MALSCHEESLVMTPPRKPSLKRPRNVAQGGIEARPEQPMGRAPLREPYGARSGDAPEKAGTPRTISSKKRRSGKGKA